MQTGIGGGNLSGHERASRLEALQSTLHGLEEVLSKRALTDKAAGVEAESLGGPAVVTSLLNGVVGNEDDAAIRAAAAAGRVNGAKAEAGTSAAGGGWLSGSQLKAFEEQVQARFGVCLCCAREAFVQRVCRCACAPAPVITNRASRRSESITSFPATLKPYLVFEVGVSLGDVGGERICCLQYFKKNALSVYIPAILLELVLTSVAHELLWLFSDEGVASIAVLSATVVQDVAKSRRGLSASEHQKCHTFDVSGWSMPASQLHIYLACAGMILSVPTAQYLSRFCCSQLTKSTLRA